MLKTLTLRHTNALPMYLALALFLTGCGIKFAAWPGSDLTNARETVVAEQESGLEEEGRLLPSLQSIPGQSLRATGDAADSSSRRNTRGIYKRLEGGQTLYSLSRLYEVPLDRLVWVNRITEPNRIRAGTQIFIPGDHGPRNLQGPVVGALSWPLLGRITSGFGPRGRRSRHGGVDIGGEWGDRVRAAAAGVVIQAGIRGNYGKVVVIDHGDGLATLYAHASKLLVRVGDRIERGESIAEVGRSGNAHGTHLHFEVREHGRPVDPIPLLQDGPLIAASRH